MCVPLTRITLKGGFVVVYATRAATFHNHETLEDSLAVVSRKLCDKQQQWTKKVRQSTILVPRDTSLSHAMLLDWFQITL
jgi:hypothetical protein